MSRAGKAAAEEGLDDEEDNRKLSPMKNGNRSTRSSGRGGGYVGINYTRGAMGRAAISTPKSKAGATSSNSTRSTAIKRTRTLDGFHSELPVEVANKKNKVSSSAKEPAAKKASEKK